MFKGRYKKAKGKSIDFDGKYLYVNVTRKT